MPTRAVIWESLASGWRPWATPSSADWHQLWGARYHRILLPDQPLDIAFTDALVRNPLRGIQCETPDEGTA